MKPEHISAVVVTRGGYDISEVVDSLQCFGQVIVCDNSTRKIDRKVYGRYLGAAYARENVIYCQDDDAIVDVRALVEAWTEAMSPMVCNMPKDRRAEYKRRPGHISLVGWGAIFHKITLGNFERYLSVHPADELFDRECDRIFTYLTPHTDVEVPFRHLPRAEDATRMGREARHGDDLTEVCRRLALLP